MLECEVKLPIGEANAVISALAEQPVNMRPTHHSNDEDSARREIDLSQLDKFDDWLGFLWAPAGGYEVSSDERETLTVFAFSDDALGIEQLIVRLSREKVVFGYAACSEERAHRNRISEKKPYGIHEGWVGRDIKRYLPGVYWITLVPLKTLENLGIALDAIREIAISTEIVENTNVLAKLYERPTEWSKKAEAVDAWCIKTSGCFSKKKVEAEAEGVTDFLEMSEIIYASP